MITEFRSPHFDKISNQWFVQEVNVQTDRVVASYEFYEESDARSFYWENDIRGEWFKPHLSN